MPAPPRLVPPALALGLAVASLSACTSDEWPPLAQDDTGTTGEDESTSAGGTTGDAFGDVHLEVFEPEGASIHLIGEAVPLLAELRDEDDLPVDFDDVVWTNEDGGPTLSQGLQGEAVLDPGIYDIAAIARLPNGDRLETKIADVRVQSRWTGRYEGDVTMVLSADFQGIPFTSVCQSPLHMRVGFDGDTFEVEPGSCTVDAVIATFDATWVLEGELESGVGGGVIRYDLAGFFELELPWIGGFIEDGFGGSFDGTASVPLVGDVPVQGTLSAVLATPYVDFDE